VLGEIDAAHAAFTDERENQVAIGDDAADERIAARFRAKGRAVFRTEAIGSVVFAAALRTDACDATFSSGSGVGCFASSPEPSPLAASCKGATGSEPDCEDDGASPPSDEGA